jgi:hypothetical protein
MPRLFPDIADRTILCNRDISTLNILVDPATSDLVSIVDWEFVTTLLEFAAVQIPQFLKGPTRDGPPAYRENTESEVYKTEVEYYEKICLRRFFLEEVARICPAWSNVFNTQRVRHDILVALDKCENDMTVKWAKSWL